MSEFNELLVSFFNDKPVINLEFDGQGYACLFLRLKLNDEILKALYEYRKNNETKKGN